MKCVSAAAGIRILIHSPLKAITLRDAVLLVLIAVVLVPLGPPSGVLPLRSPTVSALSIGWNRATSESECRDDRRPDAGIFSVRAHLFLRRPRALPQRHVLERLSSVRAR